MIQFKKKSKYTMKNLLSNTCHLKYDVSSDQFDEEMNNQNHEKMKKALASLPGNDIF